MPSTHQLPSYRAVLSTPQAAGAFAAALLGRLSYGTVTLSLLLAVSGRTGSYAMAGTVLALFGLTVSALSPARAGLIDRYGPRRALPPMAAAYASALAGLAVASDRLLLGVLAAVAGVCAPPLGPVMRALWSELLPDERWLTRAYSLDTVTEELLYVTGPLLVGLIGATAGLLVSAALVLTGTLALAASPALRAPGTRGAERAERSERAERAGRRGAAGLARPVAAAAALGLSLGALGLLMVAFAAAHGRPAAVAWAEAALSAGSALGGLAYGAVHWRRPARVRLPLLGAALAVTLALTGLAPGLWGLALLVGAAGLFVSPVLTTAYVLADECAAPGRRTRAGAWVNTAFNSGAAAGTATAGLLLGRLPLPFCFALAAAPLLLAAVRRPRGQVTPDLSRAAPSVR